MVDYRLNEKQINYLRKSGVFNDLINLEVKKSHVKSNEKLLEEFLLTCRSKKTRMNYKCDITMYLDSFSKKRSVLDLTKKDIVPFVNSLYIDESLSRRTKILKVMEVRSFFQWLEDMEYIERSPFPKKVKKMSDGKHCRKTNADVTLEIHQIKEILRMARILNPKLFLMILLQAGSGNRIAGIRNLKMNDIWGVKFQKEKNKQNWRKFITFEKGKEREYFFSEFVKVELEKYNDGIRSNQKILPDHREYFFITNQGMRHKAHETINRQLRVILRHCKSVIDEYPNVMDISTHTFRRSFVTIRRNVMGQDPIDIGILVGHQKPLDFLRPQMEKRVLAVTNMYTKNKGLLKNPDAYKQHIHKEFDFLSSI